MAALATGGSEVKVGHNELAKLFRVRLVDTLGKTGEDDMKRTWLTGVLWLAVGLFPASNCGQEAGGSLVPKDTVWKKGDVLRTSVNVEQIRFSPDGRLAVLATHQGVSVWDWQKDKEAHSFSFPKDTKLTCVAVSADGKHLATGHVDSSRVLVWDLLKGEMIRQLNHGAPVQALTFSADGATLASGGGHAPEEKAAQDTYVQLWKLADGKPMQRFLSSDQPVRTIALAASSVVAEDHRGEAFVWSRVTGKQTGRLTTHTFVTPLAMIDGGRTLIGYEVGAGRFLTKWDSALEKKDRLIDMSPTSQGIKHGFWANSDGTLAATSHPGEIIVWDLKAKERHSTLTIPREPQVTDLTFTPDSGEVVVGLTNEMVLRLNVEKAK